MDVVKDALLALFILYVLGFGFAGLATFSSIASILLHETCGPVLVKFSLAIASATALTVASVILTVAVTESVKDLNETAQALGLHAKTCDKFFAMTWAAAGLMIVTTVAWGAQVGAIWRGRIGSMLRVKEGALTSRRRT